MGKNLSLYVKLGALSLILMRCSTNAPVNQLIISDDDFKEIKETILISYNEYDTVFFTPLENDHFEEFINSKLSSFGRYYDTVFQGLLIKHFYYPRNNFWFSIVKGSDGAFYYVGFTDLKYFEDGIKNEYRITDKYSIYQDSSLSEVKENWNTSSYIRDITANDPLFKNVPSDLASESVPYYRLNQVQGLVFQLYQKQIEGFGYQFVPFFDERISTVNLKNYFLRLKTDGDSLNQREEQLFTKYANKLSTGAPKSVMMFNMQDIGIVALEIRIGGTIDLIETFIPKLIREKYW